MDVKYLSVEKLIALAKLGLDTLNGIGGRTPEGLSMGTPVTWEQLDGIGNIIGDWMNRSGGSQFILS